MIFKLVNLRVSYGKENYNITFGLDDTVENLKNLLEKETKCLAASMKLMYKGEEPAF
jgi:hypothetical protein